MNEKLTIDGLKCSLKWSKTLLDATSEIKEFEILSVSTHQWLGLFALSFPKLLKTPKIPKLV